MNNYRVSFYKDLCNSDGHSFKCLQRQIEVQSIGSSKSVVPAVEFTIRTAPLKSGSSRISA